jgi:hypothetical protein
MRQSPPAVTSLNPSHRPLSLTGAAANGVADSGPIRRSAGLAALAASLPITSGPSMWSTPMTLNRVWKSAAVASLLAGAIACAPSARQRPISAGPVATGPGTTTAARKFLEGRWILESFVVNPPGGQPITLKGSGVLTYDDFGNLEMNIKADEASADLLRAGGIVIRDGVISTTGRTAIDLQNKTLTYMLDGQASAMKTGGGPLSPNRPRHWEVSGDLLPLTIKDDSGAPAAVSRWKKN